MIKIEYIGDTKMLRYDLQMFAKEGPGGEKTEKATPKKLEEARKEGQVARSTDVVTAFMLLGLFVGLKICVGYIGNGFLQQFHKVDSSISAVTADEVTKNTMLEWVRSEIGEAILTIGNLVINIGIKIAACFLAIAAVDYFYQKRKFAEDMKMTKQEIKDEYKNSEGDPQIKGKIRAKMREASQRRMMDSVPDADVVITNPTHLAVALKYDREASSAPIVVAKGADYVAQKIKEIARENNVEIVENKPVARMLYYNVDLDQEIPPELYQAVAEILAYVYGLKQG